MTEEVNDFSLSLSTIGEMGRGGGVDFFPSKQNPHIFAVGSSVEVLPEERGYGGVFFAATVIKPTPSSQKHASKKLHVRYHYLKADVGGLEPLLECVGISMVRPVPPSSEGTDDFFVGEMVDGFHEGGWWIGVVTKVVGGGEKGGRRRFVVNLYHPPDVREFEASDLRPHMDWVDGSWVKPDKQVIPVDSGVQSPCTSKQSLSNNGAGELTLTNCSQATKRNRSPESRDSPPPLRRHKTMEDVVSYLSSSVAPTTVPTRRRSSVGAREAKEKVNSLSAHSTSKDSEKLSQPQSTDPAIGGTNRPSQDADNGLIMFLTPDETSPSEDAVHPTLGQKSSEPKRGRGRPRKNPLNFLQSPMDGDARNGIDNLRLLDKVQDNLKASEAQTAEKICNAETEEIATEAPHSKPTENLSLSIPSKEVQPHPTMAVQSMMNLGNPEDISIVRHKSPTVGDLLQEGPENHQVYPRLPFAKTPGLWEPIESMEAFKRIPQRPHFMPLEKFPEFSREGIAIGLMVTFTRVVQKLSGLRMEDPKSAMMDVLKSLSELESHGFDVRVVRNRVNELIAAKEKHQSYAEEIGMIKTELFLRRDERRRTGERIDVMKKQMEKLSEILSLAESSYSKAGEDIASLEKKLWDVEELSNSAQGCFSKLLCG